MRRFLWAFVWLAAGPAHGFCLRAQVAGRPLPSGLATLTADPRFGSPGPDERSLTRLRDGLVCFPSLRAGDYRAQIAPLGLLAPMALAFTGLEGDVSSYRLSVDANGRASVRDAADRVVREGEELSVSSIESAPREDWARVDAELVYPVSTSAAPTSLLDVWVEGAGHRFAWAQGGRASVRAPSGHVGAVLAVAPGWALAELDPPYAQRGHDSMELKPAQTLRLKLTMARTARERVRVVSPDRRPYSPSVAADASRYSVFGFTLANLYATQEYRVYADADGVVEADVPAGLWQWQPTWDGRGFAYSARAAQLRRHRAGTNVDRRYVLGAAAQVRVTTAPADAPWQSRYAGDTPIARRVLAAPAVVEVSSDSLRFLLEDEMPVVLLQGRDGWRPSQNGAATAARAAPGHYRAYLVETRRWLDFPSARVLGRREFTVEEGGTAELSFPRPADEGSAELRGSVKASMRWTLQDLDAAATLTDFHLLIAPLINLYDASGALVGMAIGNVTNKDYNAFGRAAERGDVAEAARLLYGSAREFRIKGLSPGRYRAEVVVYGYAARRFDVELTATPAVRLDVDMDKS